MDRRGGARYAVAVLLLRKHAKSDGVARRRSQPAGGNNGERHEAPRRSVAGSGEPMRTNVDKVVLNVVIRKPTPDQRSSQSIPVPHSPVRQQTVQRESGRSAH